MRVDLQRVITSFSGIPYKTEEGKDATVRYFLQYSFDKANPNDAKLSINEQLKLYSVAKRLATKRKTIIVTADEAQLLCNRLSMFSIPIIGAIAELFQIKYEQI